MKTNPAKFPGIIDVIIILLVSIVTIYIFIGFLHPDTRLVNSLTPGIALLVVWFFRIATLLAGLTVLYLYYGMRSGRVSAGSALLSVGVLLLCALVAFPVAVYFHGKTFERHIAKFHPYLQLMPPVYNQGRSNSALPPFKIFCLGGSSTEFPDKKGREWPSLLQDRLKNIVSDRDIQVSNLGRRWYTTLHTLINYQTNLRKDQPDVVLVTHAINDLLHNADFSYLSTGQFREDYGHFLGPAYRYVNEHSIFQKAGSMFGLLWYAPVREFVETTNFPGLKPFRRNLTTLIRLAQSDGTKVVLVTQPYLVKDALTEPEKAALYMVNSEAVGPTKRWSFRTAKSGMEQYTSCVRQLAAETGAYLIDLEKAVPKQLDYLYDDVHYCDKTFDLISDTIASKVVELGVLNR